MPCYTRTAGGRTRPSGPACLRPTRDPRSPLNPSPSPVSQLAIPGEHNSEMLCSTGSLTSRPASSSTAPPHGLASSPAHPFAYLLTPAARCYPPRKRPARPRSGAKATTMSSFSSPRYFPYSQHASRVQYPRQPQLPWFILILSALCARLVEYNMYLNAAGILTKRGESDTPYLVPACLQHKRQRTPWVQYSSFPTTHGLRRLVGHEARRK